MAAVLLIVETRPLHQERQEAHREGERPEEVGTHLQLEAVDRLEARGGRHDARVVDERTEGTAFFQQGVGKALHRRQIGEIQDAHVESGVWLGREQLSSTLVTLRAVTNGHDDLGARAGKAPGNLLAGAAVGAGDHDQRVALTGDVKHEFLPLVPSVLRSAATLSRRVRPGIGEVRFPTR